MDNPTPDYAAVAIEALYRAKCRADDVYASVFSHWDTRDGVPWAIARVAYDTAVSIVACAKADHRDPLMALLECDRREVREAAMLATRMTP